MELGARTLKDPRFVEEVLLLPLDPDGSAVALAGAIGRRCGVAPAVIISDSFGRPWRQGVVNIALGVAGLPALADLRGGRDRNGRVRPDW